MLKRADSNTHSLDESSWIKKIDRDELEERRGLGYEGRRRPGPQSHRGDIFEQYSISQQGPVTRDSVRTKSPSLFLEAPVLKDLKEGYEVNSTVEHTAGRASGDYESLCSLATLDKLEALKAMDYGAGFHDLRVPDRPHIRCVEPVGPPFRYSREIAPETFFYASAKHGGQHRCLTEFLDDDSVDEQYKTDMRLLFGCLDRFANDPTYIERKRWEPRVIAGGAQLYDCPEERKEKILRIHKEIRERHKNPSLEMEVKHES